MKRPPVSLALIREAVAKRVKESSLREVADEIDVSYGNLGRFIRQDTSPQKRTLALLLRWYYASAERAPEPSREDRETAIAILRNYLGDGSKPKSVRERRLRELIERLEEEGD